jgi:hypothetical protein
MRLGSPGGYHSVTSQLSRFGNSAEKPEAKWNLDGPDEMRRAASLEKANIRHSDTLENAPRAGSSEENQCWNRNQARSCYRGASYPDHRLDEIQVGISV